MAIITTTAAVATTVSISSYLLRRRISRSWIDLRHKQYAQLAGKTFIITGGTVGLGYETAKDLARRSGNVVIACRNVTKGQEAVDAICKATGNHRVTCMKLDLASLASVREFISQVRSNFESIDVLICNAGVWVPMDEHLKTDDGFEVHFGVNHLAHHLIAKSLTPQLEKSTMEDGGRIVFVSSSLMKQGKNDLSSAIHEGRVELDENGNPKKSFAPTGYCDSKLMNALTCKHLASILPRSVSAYSVCPGFCRTSLGRHVSMPLFQKVVATPIMLMIQRTQTQGAQNIIYATAEKKQNLISGGFYRDGENLMEHRDFLEKIGSAEAERLWNASEKLLEEHH